MYCKDLREKLTEVLLHGLLECVYIVLYSSIQSCTFHRGNVFFQQLENNMQFQISYALEHCTSLSPGYDNKLLKWACA